MNENEKKKTRCKEQNEQCNIIFVVRWINDDLK